MTSGLAHVKEFVVPRSVVIDTLEPLRAAGNHGYEAFVLWGGRLVEPNSVLFESAYFPEQTMSRSQHGLLVTVDGEALFRVNRAFYGAGLILAGQVHSHPTDAYHSDTDDAYPMMTVIGGLSGVVPFFGSGGVDAFDEWAWYRLADPNQWDEVDGGDVRIVLR